MNSEKIANIISIKRKEKGLTQKELAALLQVSDKAISRWESGVSVPNIDFLSQLSKILEIELNKLLNIDLNAENKCHHKYNKLVSEIKIITTIWFQISTFLITILSTVISYADLSLNYENFSILDNTSVKEISYCIIICFLILAILVIIIRVIYLLLKSK